MGAVAVVLLAGGEARRFPGKLERPVGGAPMLIARLSNASRARGMAGLRRRERDVLAGDSTPRSTRRCSSTPTRRAGRWTRCSSACRAIRAQNASSRVAADQPRLDARVFRSLAARWEPGDEARRTGARRRASSRLPRSTIASRSFAKASNLRANGSYAHARARRSARRLRIRAPHTTTSQFRQRQHERDSRARTCRVKLERSIAAFARARTSLPAA